MFDDRERQYQESYRLVPALDELCARYGDPTNRKIYVMSRDVEGRIAGLAHSRDRRQASHRLTWSWLAQLVSDAERWHTESLLDVSLRQIAIVFLAGILD